MRLAIARNLLVFPLLALAGATTQPASPAVEAAMRQLSSDNWSARQAAQQTLVRMGNAAEPALKAALQKPLDPETQSRIAEAIGEIDANRLTGPSIVTLDYDNADPKTVLADLSRQAHGRVELASAMNAAWAPPAPRNVTIHVHQQPFWMAVKQLCDATNLSPRFDNGDATMILAPGGDFLTGVSQCDGPFLVMARRIMETAELTLGPGRAVRRNTTLEMAVAAEPKLAIMGHAYMPRVDKALDDAGNSLGAQPRWMRFNPMMANSLSVDSSHMWMMSIQLQRPDDHAKKITLLQGSIRASIATRFETWTVGDILKIHDLSRSFGPSTFSINSITQTQNMYMLRVSATRLSTSPDDPALGIGQIDLFDAHGRPLVRRPMGGGGGMDSIMYNLTFDSSDPLHPAGVPVKLVWKVPTGTKMVDVPFAFRDLPLP